MSSESSKRGVRKQRTGVVVTDTMNKTIAVEVTQRYRHPLYGKVVNRKRRYQVHDEENKGRVGDTVRIAETRPISKTKRWRLVEVIRQSKLPA